MVFKMNCSPNDQKLFHEFDRQENIFTLGRGSYTGNFDVSISYGKMHVLGRRFSSLARNISFLAGGNHPMQSVTNCPLDRGRIVKFIFGEIRPKLRRLPDIRKQRYQIVFGHDVWIGRDATIMGGVKIGNGAVIGANAVVAKNIPPYAIAVGNPARVIKYRFDEETIKKLLAVKWWNWDLGKIADNFPLINDVEKFLEVHYLPELEEFPEDDFSRRLLGKNYQIVSDFEAENPLWLKVVEDFKKANLKDAALIIWFGENATEENFKSLTAATGNNKNIFAFKHDKNFSPAALKKATHFITTREMTTLAALDYLWDTDVKILSALDNDIFKQ